MAIVRAHIQTILAELRLRLQALYGEQLAQLILFGSHARGDAETGSNIDVLVVLRGSVNAGAEINRTGDIVADLSLAFDEVIACVFMDEEGYIHRQGPLLRNIRREGMAV